MYKKNIFFLLTFFGHVLTILAWTKCRLVTKHVLSITYSCFFLTFPFKFHLYKKFKLSIKDYLLLIYTFMCMIIFLSFQSHQTRTLNAGLGMAWNRYGLSCIAKQINFHLRDIIQNREAQHIPAPSLVPHPSSSYDWIIYRDKVTQIYLFLYFNHHIWLYLGWFCIESRFLLAVMLCYSRRLVMILVSLIYAIGHCWG